jgi:hypothetical protein
LTEVTNTNLLNENDKESFVQTGYYFISDGDFFKESKGKIIMNKMDLINTKNHFDNKRLNGCCGLDGLDGPNKLCNNGHEIGTEYSDCWMPHCMIFETESIRIEK